MQTGDDTRRFIVQDNVSCKVEAGLVWRLCIDYVNIINYSVIGGASELVVHFYLSFIFSPTVLIICLNGRIFLSFYARSTGLFLFEAINIRSVKLYIRKYVSVCSGTSVNAEHHYHSFFCQKYLFDRRGYEYNVSSTHAVVRHEYSLVSDMSEIYRLLRGKLEH